MNKFHFSLSDKQKKFLEEYKKIDINGEPILEGTTSVNSVRKYDLLDEILISYYTDHDKEGGVAHD